MSVFARPTHPRMYCALRSVDAAGPVHRARALVRRVFPIAKFGVSVSWEVAPRFWHTHTSNAKEIAEADQNNLGGERCVDAR